MDDNRSLEQLIVLKDGAISHRLNLTEAEPSLTLYENSTLVEASGTYQEILSYVTLTIIPFILLAGLAGNIITLILFCKPQVQRILGYYFSRLATADLLVILLWIPLFLRMIGVFDNRTDSLFVAIYYAHLEIPLLNCAMGTSIFIVVALTIDRYISACWPHHFRTIHTQENAIRAVIFAIFLSLIFSVPLCVLKEFNEQNNEYLISENKAVTQLVFWNVFILLSEIFVRFIPMILLTVLNILILRKFTEIWRKRQDLKGPNQSVLNAADYYREKRYVVMLSGVIIIFIICTLPSAIMAIVYSEDHEEHFAFLVFRNIANILEVCNFSTNFYLYIFCSSEVRKIFKSKFTCFCFDRVPTSETVDTTI